MQSSPFLRYFVFLGSNMVLNALFSNTLSFLSSLNVSDQVSHNPEVNYSHTRNSGVECVQGKHRAAYKESSTLTYLLTPWCRVLLEQLTGLQLVKKFPTFHGTRRFITALTSVRHLSLAWASPIQSIYPHPTSWRSILILSTHLRLGLPSGSFPPVSPPITSTLL